MWEQCVRERVEIFPFCTHVNDSISVKARRGKKGALDSVTWPDTRLVIVFFSFPLGVGGNATPSQNNSLLVLAHIYLETG